MPILQDAQGTKYDVPQDQVGDALKTNQFFTTVDADTSSADTDTSSPANISAAAHAHPAGLAPLPDEFSGPPRPQEYREPPAFANPGEANNAAAEQYDPNATMESVQQANAAQAPPKPNVMSNEEQQAYLDAWTAQSAPDKPTILRDEDGTKYSVPAKDVPEALSSGKFEHYSADQEKIDKDADAIEEHIGAPMTKLLIGAYSGGNDITMGLPSLFGDLMAKDPAHFQAVVEELKNRHGISSGVGHAVGLVDSLGLPFPGADLWASEKAAAKSPELADALNTLGEIKNKDIRLPDFGGGGAVLKKGGIDSADYLKAMGKGLGVPGLPDMEIASKAAPNAALSLLKTTALLSAPNIVSQGILEKDPEGAMESAVLTGVTLGALHGLGHLVLDFGAPITRPGMIEEMYKFGDRTQGSATKVPPISEEQIKEVAEKKRIANNNIWGRLGVAPRNIPEVGEISEDVFNHLNITPEDSLKQIQEKIINGVDKSGKNIGNLVNALDSTEGKEVVANIEDTSVSPTAKTMSNEASFADLNEKPPSPPRYRIISPNGVLEEAYTNMRQELIDKYELQPHLDKQEAIRQVEPATQKVKDLADELKGINKSLTKDETLEQLALRNKKNQVVEDLQKAKENLKNISMTAESPLNYSVADKQAMKAVLPVLSELDYRLKSLPEDLTFADSQKLKKFIGEQISPTSNKAINGIRDDLYSTFMEHVGAAENEIAQYHSGVQVKALGDKVIPLREALLQQRILYKLGKSAAYDNIISNRAKDVEEVGAAELFKEKRHIKGAMKAMFGHGAGGAGVAGAVVGHGVFGLGGGLMLNAIKNAVEANAEAKVISKSVNTIRNLRVENELERSTKKLSDELSASLKKKIFNMKTQRVLADTKFGAGVLAHYIGDTVGLSHKQQLEKLQDTVTKYNTNPELLTNVLGDKTAPLRTAGLNAVADEYTQHQLRLMKVISTILPPGTDIAAKANPFSTVVEPKDISPEVKAKYERALTIAADPTKLLDLVKTNQISTYDVAIAAATNPSTLQKLREAVVAEAIKSKPDLSYQQRLSLACLMGTNIEESTTQLPTLQSAYDNISPPPTPLGGPGGVSKGNKISAKAEENLTNAPMTTSQKANLF